MLAGATWAPAQQASRARSWTFEDYMQIQQLYSRWSQDENVGTIGLARVA
jgi:hypothetical protein